MVIPVVIVAVITGVVIAATTVHISASAASVIIATGALVIAGITGQTTTIRTRQKETVAAWVDWLSDTQESRKRVISLFGSAALTDEQAIALAKGTAILDKNGHQVDRDALREARNAILDVLNGLETIALLVNFKVYDLDMLRICQGNQIAETYDRFAPYVKLARVNGLQNDAYTTVEKLIPKLKYRKGFCKRSGWPV